MKKLFKKYWILATIILAFIMVRIFTLQYHAVVSWDGAVYVGMGKYLFSHGRVGTWEALRPVGLPLILGLAWKLGFNPYTAGTVFSLLVSAAFLVLIYFFGEAVKKGSGNIAVLLLATTGIFFTYSTLPLTDIASSFFAVLALFLAYKATTAKQYFFSGLVVAVAFNFRFPQGLMVIIGALLIIVKAWQGKRHKFIIVFENLFAFAEGFFVIIIPSLFMNYYYYGNAFLPYIEGTASIKGYASLYDMGFWYYFKQLFMQDPLFILAFLPIGLAWKKKYRTIATTALIIALVIVMGYFLYQVHKEIRYAIAFLPYITLLSAVGIAYILEWCNVPELLFFGFFAIAVFMFNATALVGAGQDPDIPAFYAFNTYLNEVPNARVLSSTPYMLVYSDVLLTHNLYGDWNAAYDSYNTFRSSNDYITLDSCNLEVGCADDSSCKDDKQLLLAELKAQDTEVFNETTPSQCVLSIYRINQ